MEVFTHDGIGTMVVDEKLESLREASADDVGGILQLIEPFERDGTLVRRERTEIERDMSNHHHRARRHHLRLRARSTLPGAYRPRWRRSPYRRRCRARATAALLKRVEQRARRWAWTASSC